MKTGDHSLKKNLMLQARLARRSLRRLQQAAHCGPLALAESPVMFANSFPKSGTHLLTQIMEGFTRLGPAVNSGLPAIVTFEGDTGRQRPVEEIRADLQRLLPGDIAYGHLHALPEIIQALCRPGVAAYFILRDPRDVVVSHVHYVTEMADGHIHHAYYQQRLQTFDERLCASISGAPIEELAQANPIAAAQEFTLGQSKGLRSKQHVQTAEPLPDIRARFAPYMGWLGHPEILALRYEDLLADRQAALERVLDHAILRGFRLSAARANALQTLAASIDPQRSPTFRSGKSGGWRAAFNDQHKRLFKDISGDLLVQLGYERDNNW